MDSRERGVQVEVHHNHDTQETRRHRFDTSVTRVRTRYSQSPREQHLRIDRLESAFGMEAPAETRHRLPLTGILFRRRP